MSCDSRVKYVARFQKRNGPRGNSHVSDGV